MKQSITQKHGFGCGAACVAFAANVTYDRAVSLLGVQKAVQFGYHCKELVWALEKLGLPYKSKYLKPHMYRQIYSNGVIVFVPRYPHGYGHFFIRHSGAWMDPWLNLPSSTDVTNAYSGFRKRLPGKPRYAIFPN